MVVDFGGSRVAGFGCVVVGDEGDGGGGRVKITALEIVIVLLCDCLLYTSPSPRDKRQSRMPSSA